MSDADDQMGGTGGQTGQPPRDPRGPRDQHDPEDPQGDKEPGRQDGGAEAPDDDAVTEASKESFPASDPPATY